MSSIDSTADCLPDVLMHRLLRLLSGDGSAAAHAPLLLGRSDEQSGEPNYSVAQTHTLLAEAEALRTWAHSAPAEGADCRHASLSESSRALSLALSQSLANAVLGEAAAASRGSCWAAGI